MSITNELREWAARELASWKMARERYDDPAAIADRIDEQHRRALEKVSAMVDEPSQDAFDALMDGFNIGRARGYDEGFKAHLADLEARIDRLDGKLDGMGKGAASRIEAIEGRVSAIERKLNHRGDR